MNLTRFSVFEAIVFAIKIVLDNISLFFFAFLAKLGCFFPLFLIFISFSTDIIKNIWAQLPKVIELLKSSNVELFNASVQQLWSNVSGALPQYVVIFSIFVAIAFILGIGIHLGFINMVLRLHDTGSSSVKLLFSSFDLIPKALLSMILYMIMVGVGMSLFIVPGIYLMLRGMLFPYFIVDRNAGIIDSIRKSFSVTKEHVWQLFSLVIVAPLIFQLGPASLFVIFPFMVAAQVYTYRKLS